MMSASPFTERSMEGPPGPCGHGTKDGMAPYSDGGGSASAGSSESGGGHGGGPASSVHHDAASSLFAGNNTDSSAGNCSHEDKPPTAKRRRTSCGEEATQRSVMPLYLCVPMLLLASLATASATPSNIASSAPRYRSKRPVAPSRPRGAPDVDYGGKHPFDAHRHLWDADFAARAQENAGLTGLRVGGRKLKKEDDEKNKDKDKDKDKEEEEEEEERETPRPTRRPTRPPTSRRPTNRPTQDRGNGGQGSDEEEKEENEFRFEGADTSNLQPMNVAAATAGGDAATAANGEPSEPLDFDTTTFDPATDANYRPLRIQFDARQLAQQMDLALSAGDSIAATQLYLLIYEILPMTAQVWGDILRVVPVTGGIYPLAARGSGVDQLLPNGQSNERDATTGDDESDGDYYDDPVRFKYCPDETTSGIEGGADLLIYATVNRHCPGNGSDGTTNNVGSMGTLASALSCQRDQYDRPITGSIDFCLGGMQGARTLDVESEIRTKNGQGYGKEDHMVTSEGASLEWDGWGGRPDGDGGGNDGELGGNAEVVQYAVGVAVHEIGHVLGVTSDSLAYFRHPLTGHPLTRRPFEVSTVRCVNGEESTYVGMPGPQVLQEARHEGTGSRSFEVVTPTVKRVVQNHFNCPSLTGAKLENQPTSSDCFGSHFDESLYYTEIMGAVMGQGVNILSPLTLALMEDSGWYRANYNSGYVQISSFGHGMGCDFVEESCIDANGDVPEVFQGHFCNTPISISTNGLIDASKSAQMCDPSHTQKTFCDLVNTNEVVQIGKTGATLEPAPEEFQYFAPNYRPYVFTNADYCPVPHLDPRSCVEYTGRPVSDEQLAAGEYYGADARCVETDGSRDYSLCLRTRCNRAIGKVQITAGGERRTCDYDGQVHEVLYDYDGGGELRIKCPKASLVCPDLFCPANCAGRGECRYAADVDDDADDDAFYESNAKAVCVCDEESDDSPGCFGTTPTFPAAYGYAYEDQAGANKTLFMVIVGSLVAGLAILFVAVRQWKAKQNVFM